jgi:hypothetical protein
MRRILFAASVAASVLALPTFAQVVPTGAGASTKGSAHAGVATTGAPSNTGVGSSTTDASASSDATATSDLGLGGLLKQTQAAESSTSLEGNASMSSSSDAKALAGKARAHGH